jgi:hypothetical protein
MFLVILLPFSKYEVEGIAFSLNVEKAHSRTNSISSHSFRDIINRAGFFSLFKIFHLHIRFKVHGLFVIALRNQNRTQQQCCQRRKLLRILDPNFLRSKYMQIRIFPKPFFKCCSRIGHRSKKEFHVQH